MLIESEKQVQTAYGNISITIYGDRHKIPILTLHDVGSNAEETFARFFQSPIGDEIGAEFCIYNINAPDQQKNVKEFPFWYHYPTMDNFVHIIEEIVDFFSLKSFVGFGVGAGANIMLRYALKHQDNVNALILINCVINPAGWYEWIYQKSNILLLRHLGMSEATIDYFTWWHFGSLHHKRNPHEVTRYQEYLRKEAHPKSLAAFLESYMNRTPIEIITKHENENHAFRIPILHMVGSHSAFLHEAIRMNKLLEQQNTIEIMEFTDCGGNFLIEKANKVFEAILLFLQGAGFFASLNVHDVIKRAQEEENEMILRNEETKDSASNDKPLEKEDVFAD